MPSQHGGYKASPGSSEFQVKQMHGYSDGRICSGGIVRGLEIGDLQWHNAPLSYQRSVATIQVAWYGENLFPFPFSTLIWRCWVQPRWLGKTFLAKINKLLTWRDDIHVHADFPTTLPSHTSCSLLPQTFLPLLLLGLEILSKLLTIARTHTGFLIFLFYPSIH